MSTRYDYTRTDLELLLLQKFFPERPNGETAIIRDFLRAHGTEYDRFDFTVRVGVGLTPDPAHLPGVQRNTVESTKKKIDMMLWQGAQATIAEVKQRVNPATLGQLQTYRHLWLEENPDAREPILIAIGRTSDDDTLRVLGAAGITVYLYDEEPGRGGDAGGGLPPDDAETT